MRQRCWRSGRDSNLFNGLLVGLLPLLEADLSFADLGDRVSTTARRDEIPGTDDNERGNDKKKDYAKENALVATDGFKHGDAPLCAAKVLAEWTGLEPATPGVTGRYSNQLNYHSLNYQFLSDYFLLQALIRSTAARAAKFLVGAERVELPTYAL